MTENQEVLVTILVRIVIVLNIILESVIIIVIVGLDINLASSVINIPSAVYLDKNNLLSTSYLWLGLNDVFRMRIRHP